jgi:hypothetical protein
MKQFYNSKAGPYHASKTPQKWGDMGTVCTSDYTYLKLLCSGANS